MLETGACSQCVVLFHLPNIRVAGAEVFRIIQESGTLLHRYPRNSEKLPLNLLSLMKHKKERMYMAYMIQQCPQQISTESLAYQKRKPVADNAVECKASSFFFPLFVFRSTDSTKSTVESVSDITTIIPDGVTEVAIMYGGVASGTKIRIIRICGAKFAATPPHQNRNAE